MRVFGPGGEVAGMVTQSDLLRAVFTQWQHGTGSQ
jgi:CBS-domain-containing membrane protein